MKGPGIGLVAPSLDPALLGSLLTPCSVCKSPCFPFRERLQKSAMGKGLCPPSQTFFPAFCRNFPCKSPICRERPVGRCLHPPPRSPGIRDFPPASSIAPERAMVCAFSQSIFSRRDVEHRIIRRKWAVCLHQATGVSGQIFRIGEETGWRIPETSSRSFQ